MKLLCIPYLLICILCLPRVCSYIPAIHRSTFRMTKPTKSITTSLRSTYGNRGNDPYSSPIDPYNEPSQQNSRYSDPAYRENNYYDNGNYGYNPFEPVRSSVNEQAYSDPLYNYDTQAPRGDWQYDDAYYQNEYQMGPSSGVNTHYEAGLGRGTVQDGDKRGSVAAFTYGPSDQSEKPKVTTSVDSPYGTSVGQDENYVAAYDPAYDPRAVQPEHPATYGQPPSRLSYPDYSDFTFGPGSSIASKGRPLEENPRDRFDGGMLFSEEERRVNPPGNARVSRRAPPMPQTNDYSSSYKEESFPRPFDYGPNSSVDANRFEQPSGMNNKQGPYSSFAYGPDSSVKVDSGGRREPNEYREPSNYGPSSTDPRVDERSGDDNRWGGYNVKSTSDRSSYDRDQENDEDVPEVFATRHKISQDIKNLMQKVMLGKKSKVPEVVQGALQARQEIKELLALSNRNLERQVLKLEKQIDEMDISPSKVEACKELQTLKDELDHERKVQMEMDMEIGDILSPSSALFKLYEPEVVNDTPFDDRYQGPIPRGPGRESVPVSTIRSGNTTYTRSAPPFQYGPGSSIATASADLKYPDPQNGFGSAFTFSTEPDTSNSVDAKYDEPPRVDKKFNDISKNDVVEKLKSK